MRGRAAGCARFRGPGPHRPAVGPRQPSRPAWPGSRRRPPASRSRNPLIAVGIEHAEPQQAFGGNCGEQQMSQIGPYLSQMGPKTASVVPQIGGVPPLGITATSERDLTCLASDLRTRAGPAGVGRPEHRLHPYRRYRARPIRRSPRSRRVSARTAANRPGCCGYVRPARMRVIRATGRTPAAPSPYPESLAPH